MRGWIIGFWLGLAGAAVAGEVPESLVRACEGLPVSSLTVSVAPQVPVVRQEYTAQQLRQLTAHAGGDLILAATEFKASVDVDIRHRFSSDPATGLACGRVEVSVRMGAEAQEIHIASEIPAGSCPYRAVLQGEMAQVRSNESRMRFVALALNGIARGEFAQRVWFGTPEEIAAAAREEITRVWMTRASSLLQTARELDASQRVKHSNALFSCEKMGSDPI